MITTWDDLPIEFEIALAYARDWLSPAIGGHEFYSDEYENKFVLPSVYRFVVESDSPKHGQVFVGVLEVINRGASASAIRLRTDNARYLDIRPPKVSDASGGSLEETEAATIGERDEELANLCGRIEEIVGNGVSRLRDKVGAPQGVPNEPDDAPSQPIAPRRQADYEKWARVWGLWKRHNGNMQRGEFLRWLATVAPDDTIGDDTLSKIIRAGRAGELAKT